MIIFLLLLPFLTGIPLGIVLHFMFPNHTPINTHRTRYRGGRKSKGFMGSLMSSGKRRGGVMCGPGGRGPRGGRRR